MPEKGEMVIIEMAPSDRLRLYGQITGRMEKLGYNACDYRALNLGFELPANWPVDINAEPTLAQLVVLARKLEMRIVIDNLNLVPLKESEKAGEDGVSRPPHDAGVDNA